VDLDAKAVQSVFGELVGISQQAVSKQLDKGVLTAGESYRQWLVAYCSHLRELAAGRGGDDAESLMRARTADALASAELKQLQIQERAGQLVPVEDIEPAITAMVTAARTELLTLPQKVAAAYRGLYGNDHDPSIVEELVHESLSHLARGLPAIRGGDDEAGDPDLGATAQDDDDGMG